MQNLQCENVRTHLLDLQDSISLAIEAEDGLVRFSEDSWLREGGGGGQSRLLNEGAVFEKAGINFSDIEGNNLPDSATAKRPQLAGAHFRAIGLSLVIHPRNPHIPTSHMNLRFFYAEPTDSDPVWWFGGGFDLTPYYGQIKDAVHWHRTARAACLPYGVELYPKLKQNCDEYFYLPHRKEPRGIGGIFFDDYNAGGFERAFSFTKSVGDHYLPAYQPIVARRKNKQYTETERQFQIYRRGRYVEFNLIHDRGTLFGLQSNGRTESILMSLPPVVRWEYNYQPELGTPEAELYEVFLKPKNWADLEI